MSNGQGLFRGGMWTLAAKGLSVLAAVLTSALAARSLQQDAFGALVLSISIITFAGMVGSLGLHLGLVRVVALTRGKQSGKSAGQYIVGALALSLLVSSVLGLIAFVWKGDILALRILNAPQVYAISSLLFLWLILRAQQLTLGAALRGMRHLGSAAFVDNAISGLVGAGVLVYIYLAVDAPSLHTVVTGLVFAHLIAISYGIFLVYRIGNLQMVRGLETFRSLLTVGPPLMLYAILAYGITDTHVWLLAALGSEAQVGEYGAAYQLVKLAGFPLIVVNAVIPPFITKLHQKANRRELQNLMRQSASVCAAPSLVIGLLFLLIPGSILNFVFGPDFIEAKPSLMVLGFGYVLRVVTGSPGILLAMTGHGRVLIMISVFAVATGLLVSFPAILELGTVGAAIGATAAMVTQKLALSYYVWRRLGVFTHAGILPLIAAAKKFRQKLV